MRTLPLLALGLELAACAPENSPCATQYRKDFNRIGLQGEAADQMVLELCDINASKSLVVLQLDRDHDGYFQGDDCNDNDAKIHPNAKETCDNVDNNCDGEVDAEDPQLQDWPHFTGIATNSTTGETMPVCCESTDVAIESKLSIGTKDKDGELICKLGEGAFIDPVSAESAKELPVCGKDGEHSKGIDDHPICKVTNDFYHDSVTLHEEMGLKPGWTVQTFVLPDPIPGDTWATRLARVAPQQQ